MLLFLLNFFGGSSSLIESLERHPRLAYLKNHYPDPPHRLLNLEVPPFPFMVFSFNYQLNKQWLKLAKFILHIEKPEVIIRQCVLSGYSEVGAARYYQYRLRRLAEVAKQTECFIYDNNVVELQKWLGFKQPLGIEERKVELYCGEWLNYLQARYQNYARLINANIHGSKRAF